jgi:hypothetical protein
MASITIKGFVMKAPYANQPQFVSCDMSEHGYLMIGPLEFEYTMPEDFNEVKAEIACLDRKLAAINKDHANQVRMIKQRKNDLLCIENKEPKQPAAEVKLPQGFVTVVDLGEFSHTRP